VKLVNRSSENLVFPVVGLWESGREREFPEEIAAELLRNANIAQVDESPVAEPAISEPPVSQQESSLIAG
jgi:hypothetical protein